MRGVVDRSVDDRCLTELLTYAAEDDESSAIPWDMEDGLPKLYAALWTLVGFNKLKRIRSWAMLLVSISVMARASCVTQFCPDLRTMKLPPKKSWDTDGLPSYIQLSWTSWKSRSPKKKQPYPMRIHRNYVDQRFCPVFWLLLYLKYAGHTDGPVFRGDRGGNISADMWRAVTNHLFWHAYVNHGFQKGCTNHSIRRSSAQWAARCGATEMEIRNAGRWRCMEVLARYLAQGYQQRSEFNQEAEEDPIIRVWLFHRVTVANVDGQDIM